MASVIVKGRRFRRAPRFAPPPSRAYGDELRVLVALLMRRLKAAVLERYPRWVAALDKSQHSDAGEGASINVTIEGVRAEIDPFVSAEARKASRKQAEQVKSSTRAKANKQIKALRGVEPIAQEPWLNEFIDLFVESNTGLIKKLESEQAERVGKVVREGALSGSSLKEIAKEIDAVTDVGMRHAKLLARDQTAKLNSQIAEVRMRRAGVEQYQWSGSLDERERATHLANEGKIFRWDSPPPQTGHPGEDINCRCVAIPVFGETTQAEEQEQTQAQEPQLKAEPEAQIEAPQQVDLKTLAAKTVDDWLLGEQRFKEIAEIGGRLLTGKASGDPELKGALSFLYDQTQKRLAEQKVKELVLYRGVGGRQAAELAEALKQGGKAFQLDTRSLSSFSTSRLVAQSFADESEGTHGAVVKIVVPADKAVFQLGLENEVVIIGVDGFTVDGKDVGFVRGVAMGDLPRGVGVLFEED